MHGLYVGLMSGTSLDGVDAVLLGIDDGGMALRGHVQWPLPATLRDALDALNRSGDDELHRAQLAALGLADCYADAVAALLATTAVRAGAVRAIGAHGQTVRHRPELGYTVQLNAPARLAERCGITVVADFRSRDIAAGGQGAPLVPAFHRAWFGRPGEALAVLNLGGIANLSLLDAAGGEVGFDCGPGNTLLDAWVQRHLGRAYDAAGAWAAGGEPLPALLASLLADPYFAAAPPKSTGRDRFHLDWLQRALDSQPAASPQRVQATLAELSARAAADALRAHAPDTVELLVCGGGACNDDLMARLRRLLPGVAVHDSATRGLPAQQVEGAAFAWLAARTLAGLPGNAPAATGARGPRVLGAIHPA